MAIGTDLIDTPNGRCRGFFSNGLNVVGGECPGLKKINLKAN